MTDLKLDRILVIRLRYLALSLIACIGLSACAPAPEGVDFHDPHEKRNRAVHQLNKDLDRAVLRPAANAYGTVAPKPLRKGVSNFTKNLSLPNQFINNVLQADFEGAVTTFMAFAFNSTFGLGGLIDFAGEAGMEDHETDFGETLYVWGVGEGTYVELPALGPSTARDATGVLVDIVLLDPIGAFAPKEVREAATTGEVLDVLDSRYEFKGTLDTVLYETPDSYIAVRNAYLQNRRFDLQGGLTDDDFEDPYEDF